MKQSKDLSFFLIFHNNSKLADIIFSSNPTYEGKLVRVLQFLPIEKEKIIVECIFK